MKGKPIERGCLVMVVGQGEYGNSGRTGIAEEAIPAGGRTSRGGMGHSLRYSNQPGWLVRASRSFTVYLLGLPNYPGKEAPYAAFPVTNLIRLDDPDTPAEDETLTNLPKEISNAT